MDLSDTILIGKAILFTLLTDLEYLPQHFAVHVQDTGYRFIFFTRIPDVDMYRSLVGEPALI